jgi:hypothetical protein
MQIRAYAFGSGEIGFTSGCVPAGALIIAKGEDKIVRETVSGLARRAYDNETLLVPGVPEAQDEGAGYEAFKRFHGHVQNALGKVGA